MSRKVVNFLVVVLVFVVLLQSSFAIYTVLHAVSGESITAKATGSVQLCINKAPYFLPYDCNTSVYQNDLHTCQLFVVDDDGDDVSYGYVNVQGNLSINISINGLVRFRPIKADVGNNTIAFTALDEKQCSNSLTNLTVNFTIINVNDAPRYLPNFGLADPMGPYEWSLSSSLRGIFLENYFDDPDNDTLAFSYYDLSSGFSISILPTSEIVLGATQCGEGHVFFRATDPFGLYADSGLVVLNVPCEEPPPAPDPGMGGGETERCISEWRCEDWGTCLPNGTQRRRCTDIYACNDNYIRWFSQPCEYIEQCYNGVQDFFWEGHELNEDGVDCGGPCPICATCFDGMMNCHNLPGGGEICEESIDCGGPCNSCPSCSDGVKNCHILPDGSEICEDGVDCGGPCDVCATCFDGVQNCHILEGGEVLCEDGVDCGGPCTACSRIETPSVVDSRSKLLTVLLMLFGIVGVLFVLYRLFKKQIHFFIAKLLWYLTKTRRKQFLLTPEQKVELLKSLAAIEAKDLLASAKTYAQFQNETARVLHDFFSMLLANKKLKLGVAYEEAFKSIDALKTTPLAKKILKRHFSLLMRLEREEIAVVEELKLQFELLRLEIFNFSKTTRYDIARPIEELSVDKDASSTKLIQVLYNGVLALQFNELAIAKKKYLFAFETYSSLVTSQQEKTFSPLQLFFEQITYVGSFVDHLEFSFDELLDKDKK
jgi:hypothetical protein